MMISVAAFELLISAALLVTCFSPLLLGILLYRDYKNGDLW